MLIAYDRRTGELLGQACPDVLTEDGLVCLLNRAGYLNVPRRCVLIVRVP